VITVKALLELIDVGEAIRRLVDALSRTLHLDVETVNLTNAIGKVLAEEVYATIDRPGEDISAVDGYAVRSLDTVGASYYNPVELTASRSVKPGERPAFPCIEPGVAVEVYTGTPIPCGADAVVMSEDVEVRGDRVLVYKPVAGGSNIIFKGEDFKKGDLLATRGTLIKPALLAALAANGVDKVKVYRKINVSIIAVGDELVEPGKEAPPGKVYDSSTYIVYSSLVRDLVFNAKYSGIVPDDVDAVANAVAREFERGADVVITTGGTGVGRHDIVVDFVKRHGEFVFRGVKLRPGRPTSSSVVGGKLLLHLSGFPIAAWTGYEVLFRTAVIKWLGVSGLERHSVYALLTRRLPNVAGYTSIVRVNVFERHGELYAEPYMLRGSGVISSMLRTNGYVVLPENVEGFEKNTRVKVYFYD